MNGALKISPPVSQGSSPVSSPAKLQGERDPSPHSLTARPLFPNLEPSSATKPATKFTSMEGVKETMKTLYEFNLLLMRVIGGPTEGKLKFDLPEINELFEEATKADISKVQTRRPGIDKLASKHASLLLNYNTYLRGVLEELAKSGLLNELGEIEGMLKKRILPKESATPSSPIKSSSLMSKEQELPASLTEAWEKLRRLAELKGELALLKTKFFFVQDELPEDAFANEYRENESILFLNKFGQFVPECAAHSNEQTVDWQSKEIAKVKRAVTESFEALKKQVAETSFLEGLSDCDLNIRVTAIADEFVGNSALSEQVSKFRMLFQAIVGLKEIISIENQSEHLRQNSDRLKLHQRRVREFESLRSDVMAMDIGATMNTIQELMDKAVKASNCIQQMYEHTKKTLEIFDQTLSSRSSDKWT